VAVDLRSLAKLVVAAAGNLSHVFLAVVFFSSLYWFIFFKQQTFVHTMLPSPDQAQKTSRQNQCSIGLVGKTN
jgi:cytoskeletal protein RodZ